MSNQTTDIELSFESVTFNEKPIQQSKSQSKTQSRTQSKSQSKPIQTNIREKTNKRNYYSKSMQERSFHSYKKHGYRRNSEHRRNSSVESQRVRNSPTELQKIDYISQNGLLIKHTKEQSIHLEQYKIIEMSNDTSLILLV